MIHCIIIEDQPPAQRILKKYISEIDKLSLKNVFSDPIKAKAYIEKEPIDLIFLDIHLPKISGIDFLRSIPNHPKTILTTAFSDYALESYEFNVIDYLLKPISYDRFLQAISKLENTIEQQKVTDNTETLVIKSGYDYIKLNTSDIVFIKSDSDYTEVTTLEKTYLSKDSLKQWLEKLNSNSFCQVHKSYLINVQYMEKVYSNTIHLKNADIPLGRAFKKDFIKHYLK